MLTATPQVGAQVRRRTSDPKLGYRPALDGIRALAVAAVFAYHAHLPWARAGFLGVDVFFVLSGYLITALLLTERRREGRIDLRRFWMRRARRLLPAVLVLLAGVAIAVPVLAPEQAYRLRADLLSALGYVSNWRMIFARESYFQAAGRPPLLQHLWSLAVEEQFYLLWPPVLLFLLRRRPYRRLAKGLLVGAAASAGLMALLFQPFTDPSRVYYGTDTRAAGLLVGAALAAATTRWQLVDRIRRTGVVLLEVLGFLGLAGLVWAVSKVNEFDATLYRGGFLAVAFLAAALVAVAARPGRPILLGRVLGMRPLVWLGKRSYSIYLWFWPVLMVTRADLDVHLSGTPLLALQIGATILLAAASYRFVERPTHNGALGRMWADIRRAWRTRTPIRRRSAAWGLAFSVTLACVGVGIVIGDETREPDVVTVAAGLNSAAIAEVTIPTTAVPVTTTTLAPTTTTTTAPTPTTNPVTTTIVASTVIAADPSLIPTISANVTAIGDSVMLGAKPLLELQVSSIVVDAAVARQFPEVLSTVRSYRNAGKFGDAVILHTGNNGPISSGQFDQLMEAVKGVRRVIVVNVKVGRPWEDQNNDVFREGVPRWPNAVLVDWHAIASNHPEAFVDDGLHLTSPGIRLFTSAVLGALSPA